MRRRDALYLCGNLLDADELRAEAEAREAIGLKGRSSKRVHNWRRGSESIWTEHCFLAAA